MALVYTSHPVALVAGVETNAAAFLTAMFQGMLSQRVPNGRITPADWKELEALTLLNPNTRKFVSSQRSYLFVMNSQAESELSCLGAVCQHHPRLPLQHQHCGFQRVA